MDLTESLNSTRINSLDILAPRKYNWVTENILSYVKKTQCINN